MPRWIRGPHARSHTGLILAVACIAQFMVVLDVSVVNVALATIGRDLHYSATGLQWVVNAYVLTFAGFLLLGGRAADLFGQRRVFLIGLAIFTGASLAGGFAQSETWLTDGAGGPGVRRRDPVARDAHDHRDDVRGAEARALDRHVERGRWRRRRRPARCSAASS